MLENTFCHINGIGEKTESRLWQAGVTDWRSWREVVGVSLSQRARMEIPWIFEQSLEALEENRPSFFSSRLKSGDVWRLFTSFRQSTAYVDIETTGLGDYADITTIALYDGEQVRHYVNGENLEQFTEDVYDYTVLVSYNGKSFDIPVLEDYFKISLPQAQIDLRFVLAKLGLKGGLKGCERQVGINRGALDGVDGSFAVHLWQLYQNENEPKALETLLAYNIEDTVNLERLLVEAWNRNVAKTPFAGDYYLELPVPPPLLFQPDFDCVERVKRRMGRYQRY